MKKFNLSVAMIGAVAMTACTDYKTQITEAHDDYVKNVGASFGDAGRTSGCQCSLLATNLLPNGLGGYYYDYGLYGENDIYWKVDGCNAEYFFLATMAETGGGSFVYLDKGYGTSAEFPARVTTGEGGNASIKVDVQKDASTIETLLCPAVEVRGVNYGSSSVSTGSSACGDIWCGIRDGSSRVNTGFAKTENNGYWYTYTDQDDNGNSEFTYPVDPIIGSVNYFDPIIQQYGGIKGTVTLQDGYQYPYAGLGFDLVSGNREGVDITDWNGLCIVYKSTVGFYVKIPVEDEEHVVEWDNYRYKLRKSDDMTIVNIPWNDFRQAKFGKVIDLPEALKMVAAITIEFNDDVGSPEDFFIQSIGRYGTCQ